MIATHTLDQFDENDEKINDEKLNLTTISNNGQRNDLYIDCSPAETKSKEILQENVDTIEPILLPGVNGDNLFNTNVFVGISILPKSPLLTDSGSFQLISFVGSLPKQSIIILVDELNKHNVKAMARGTNGKVKILSDQKAVETALKAGEAYFQIFTRSLNRLKIIEPKKAAKITILRWRDVENETMKKQQAIMHNNYQTNEYFKQKIDKIALDFLIFRRPHSKNHETRIPHMVNYILGELPIMLTGVKYKGIHYKTLLYPTAASKAKSGSCMANDVFYLAHEIQTGSDFVTMKKEVIEIGQIEASEGVTLLPISEVDEDKTVISAIPSKRIEELMRTTSIGV